jgi:hypothetical protein
LGLTTRATLACPIIPRMDMWLNEIVQPAAATYLGSPWSRCGRARIPAARATTSAGAKLSEHSFGNAVDVMGFRLADGREVTVIKGWRGAPEEQDFCARSFVGACQLFNTVLRPRAPTRSTTTIPPRPRASRPARRTTGVQTGDQVTPAQPGRRSQPAVQPEPSPRPELSRPVELDEEEDPFVIDAVASRRASRRVLSAHRERRCARRPERRRAACPGAPLVAHRVQRRARLRPAAADRPQGPAAPARPREPSCCSRRCSTATPSTENLA